MNILEDHEAPEAPEETSDYNMTSSTSFCTTDGRRNLQTHARTDPRTDPIKANGKHMISVTSRCWRRAGG